MNVEIIGQKFEQATRLLCEYMPLAETLIKPTLFHCIRVGVYLYHHNYSLDIIIAGIMHDALEDTDISEELLEKEFGLNVLRIVKANSVDETITDFWENKQELISRCIENGEDSMIVKASDIFDSFNYYSQLKSQKGLDFCIKISKIIFDKLPENFSDEIFNTLKNKLSEYS